MAANLYPAFAASILKNSSDLSRPSFRRIWGSQPSKVLALAMSGRRVGVVLGQRFKAQFALRSGHIQDRLGALEDGELTGVADVDEKVFGGAREAQDAFDQVVHVAEAAGLAAVVVGRQRLAAQLETGARTSPRPARRDGIPRRRT
jgi:hypothetical protein